MIEETETKTVMLLSGGLDSSACAHLLFQKGFSLEAVFIDYGQAAVGMEAKAATAIANHLSISMSRYSVVGAKPYSIGELTGRNAFLISAALFLTSIQSGIVAIGLHAGTSYYDCSEHFVNSMANLVSEQTNGQVSLLAPFIDWGKQDIFDYFTTSGLPLNLTYSCEAGTEPPCGVCSSCKDRMALEC